MKSIKNMINEARQIEYRVSMIDVLDNEDLPITVAMVVDKEYQRSFEDWLEDQQDNLFSHAEGGGIEY